MRRQCIAIEEWRCTGCGLCLPDCPVGALEVRDGKSRLVSDRLCDGAGACVGACPNEAIRVVERESEPYDERRLMAWIAPRGPACVRDHLEALLRGGEDERYGQAIAFLDEDGAPIPVHGHGKTSAARPDERTTPSGVADGDP